MRLLVLTFLLMSSLCFGKTVVVVESYHIGYGWDAGYVAAIRSVLGEDHEIRTFALDTKRLPKPEWPQQADKAQSAIADIKPDIVIVGDDNAFTLMGDYLVDRKIPVVFLGINGGPAQHPTLEHPLVTGIFERPFFEESIRHLRRILPQEERFLVLMDDSPTMRKAVNEYFDDKRQDTIYGSEVDIVLTNDRDTWLQTVINAHKRYDAVILGTHHTIRDEAGQYILPKNLLEEASDKAQLPLFSFWDMFVGENQSVGGFTISAYQEGLTAARLASLILNDVKPDQIPHLKSLSGHYVYSKSELARWGLKLSPMISSQANFVE